MKPDADGRTAPISTYRLQFNRHFTFRDALEVVPYLDDLGIGALYASPYLQARPGSLHGYDISNHGHLNPEVGTPEDHRAMTRELRARGMGHLLDIVPNHMGIGEPDNEWWMDVLENGPSSPYSPYFDIEWEPLQPQLAGRVLLPILGDQFGQVLERGELELTYGDGGFEIRYHEHRFPVSPKSSSLVLRQAVEGVRDEDHRLELESIVTALEKLPSRDRTDPDSVAERRRENRVTHRRVSDLHAASADFREALAATITRFNGTPGEPHSFDQLERLLDDQAYRLAFWRVAAEEINYRRFFDINELAGIRVERPEVFEATHRLILQMVREGLVTGLRIDHPDGLYDPVDYLQRLHDEVRRATAAEPYLLVEKILTGDETLPQEWPVAGTVGYEFMNRLNGLFVPTAAAGAMEGVYSGFLGRSMDFEELVYDKKKLILRAALASELNVLANLLDRLSEENRRYRDFTLGALTDALRETIACFPVYRTYIDATAGRLSDTDRGHVERATREAMRRNPTTSRLVYEFLRGILLLRWPDDLNEDARREHARFVMKFQQLTGPVMAKGVEDTTFYIYNRLISLNEVGGEPERFGTEPEEFHAWMSERSASWPAAMNSTSTHDTKRSEDVRARIDALAEMPEHWGRRVRLWAELNAPHKQAEDGLPMPDRNDEYLLYQTLIGAWPLHRSSDEEHEVFVARIQDYMEKATREAKVRTSWINPNEEYDEALRTFVGRVLDRGRENRFLADFVPFQEEIARIGMLTSLSQTALKLMAPGVPDVYQGQEIWDFSLVDPDNRRPIDFDLRREMLAQVARGALEEDSERRAEFGRGLLEEWKDGRIKMHLVRTLLHLRRSRSELFVGGGYVPLEVSGPRAGNVIAFARRAADSVVIVAAPRLWGEILAESDGAIPGPEIWSGTELALPAGVGGGFRDVLGGGRLEAREEGGRTTVRLEDALAGFPVGVLERA